MFRRITLACLLLAPLFLAGCHSHWWDDDCYYCDWCDCYHCDGHCPYDDWYPYWVVIANTPSPSFSPAQAWLTEQIWYGPWSIAGAGDVDWFGIETNNDYIHIQVDFDDSLGDIDVALYDDDGHLLANAISVTDNETLIYGPVSYDGVYYIRVYGVGSWSGDNFYSIWWDDRDDWVPVWGAGMTAEAAVEAPVTNG